MKVLELLNEGFLADQRDKVGKVKQAIANVLKLPRHRVVSNRLSGLALGSEEGLRWLIAAPVPDGAEGEDAQFHLRMFKRLFEREIAKQFEKWKVESVQFVKWESAGKLNPMMVITFFTPDMDGLLP